MSVTRVRAVVVTRVRAVVVTGVIVSVVPVPDRSGGARRPDRQRLAHA